MSQSFEFWRESINFLSDRNYFRFRDEWDLKWSDWYRLKCTFSGCLTSALSKGVYEEPNSMTENISFLIIFFSFVRSIPMHWTDFTCDFLEEKKIRRNNMISFFLLPFHMRFIYAIQFVRLWEKIVIAPASTNKWKYLHWQRILNIRTLSINFQRNSWNRSTHKPQIIIALLWLFFSIETLKTQFSRDRNVFIHVDAIVYRHFNKIYS